MSGAPLNMLIFMHFTTFVKLLISKDSELRLKSADGGVVEFEYLTEISRVLWIIQTLNLSFHNI